MGGLNRGLDMGKEMKKLTAKQDADQAHNKEAAELLKSKKCKKALAKVYDQADSLETKLIATCTKMAKKADGFWQAFKKAQAEKEEKEWEAKLAKNVIRVPPQSAEHEAKTAKPKSVKTVAAHQDFGVKDEIPKAAQMEAPVVQEKITKNLEMANEQKNEAAQGLKKVLEEEANPAKAIKIAHESIINSQTAAHKEEKADDEEASNVANTPVASLYQSEVELFQDVLP